MSLAKELAKSSKIDTRSQMTLAMMPEGADENEVSLSLIFQSRAAVPATEGLQINSTIGTIYTARASLRGLKALVENQDVYRIEGGRLLR
ncbi:MAG: hypothetical protein KJ667_01090, partial [Alphaproteobacteria bacterium]|nr:hypothetical protein [Alphaproteobacteria bacterium]